MEYRGVVFEQELDSGQYNLTQIWDTAISLREGVELRLYDFKRKTHVVEYIIRKYEELHGEPFRGDLIRKSSGIYIKDLTLIRDIMWSKKGKGGKTLAEEGLCKLAVDAILGVKADKVRILLQQECCLKTIEQLLGVNLLREFRCLEYKIDGYDQANNIAYEIDESQHGKQSNLLQDEKRRKEIQEVLGCRFKRIVL